MDIHQEGLQIEQRTKEEFIHLDGVLQMRVISFITGSNRQPTMALSLVAINETYTDIMEKLLNAMFTNELTRESFNDLESQIKNARLRYLDMLNQEV